ncbi:MAG: efflux RND transporter periplasmic adaptor subunit, partial [Cyclobacteriaceae bacterium]|nr:efflux RND transporter periplasmic adaptor subunit [Cyclobacteriaceae bacterium]
KSKISGTIASIDYKNGQNVKKGAILVKLENTREALALEKARANYNERLNEYNSQLIGFSKQNLTDTIRNSLRYSTGLSRAEIELKEAELSFRNTVIRAPISGVISNLSVHPGNNVEPSLSLCHIHNPSKMNVEVRILESDIGKIKKGLECRLSPVSYKDNPYPGTIKEINPRIVPETGMGIVAVQVNQPQGLLPGMHVNVEIKVPHEKNILVPSDAVVIRSGKKVVFTTKNGIAAWNYVECGKENGRDIEILNGINDGDTVIISNNLQLAHDAKVKIIQP